MQQKPFLFSLIAVAVILFFFSSFHLVFGQAISPLDQFTATTSPTSSITQRTYGKTIRITGLSDGCLGLTSGLITSNGTPCGSGSGSGGGTGFWTRLNNSGLYPATSTDQVLIGASATTSTAKLDVEGKAFITGTLGGSSATDNFLNVSGTLPAVATVATNGVNIGVISAGSSSVAQNAETINFTAGYTGSSATVAANIANAVQGTGTGGWGGNTGTANFGLNSLASSNTTGNNVAVGGFARNSSTLNIGISGRATTGFNSPAVNVGVTGEATAATTSVAGFFGLFSGTPTLATSSALIADNGTSGGDLQIWQTAGVLKDVIGPGGNLSLGTSNPWAQFTLVSSSTSANVPIFDIASSSGASASFFNVQSLGQVNVASGNLNISTTTAGCLGISGSGSVFSQSCGLAADPDWTVSGGYLTPTTTIPVWVQSNFGVNTLPTFAELQAQGTTTTSTGRAAYFTNSAGSPVFTAENDQKVAIGGSAPNAALEVVPGVSVAPFEISSSTGPSTNPLLRLSAGDTLSVGTSFAYSPANTNLRAIFSNTGTQVNIPVAIFANSNNSPTTIGFATQGVSSNSYIGNNGNVSFGIWNSGSTNLASWLFSNGNLGLGASSTPFSLLSLDVASPTAGTLSTNAVGVGINFTIAGVKQLIFSFDNYGHEVSGGPKPSVSSCGVSPSIFGTDNEGVVYIGSGVGVNSCTVTYANPMQQAPSVNPCIMSQVSGTILSPEVATSTTGFVFTASNMGGDVYNYFCGTANNL